MTWTRISTVARARGAVVVTSVAAVVAMVGMGEAVATAPIPREVELKPKEVHPVPAAASFLRVYAMDFGAPVGVTGASLVAPRDAKGQWPALVVLAFDDGSGASLRAADPYQEGVVALPWHTSLPAATRHVRVFVFGPEGEPVGVQGPGVHLFGLPDPSAALKIRRPAPPAGTLAWGTPSWLPMLDAVARSCTAEKAPPDVCAAALLWVVAGVGVLPGMTPEPVRPSPAAGGGTKARISCNGWRWGGVKQSLRIDLRGPAAGQTTGRWTASVEDSAADPPQTAERCERCVGPATGSHYTPGEVFAAVAQPVPARVVASRPAPRGRAVGQWVDLVFDRPVRPVALRVMPGAGGACVGTTPDRAIALLDDGSAAPLALGASPQGSLWPLPAGVTRRVRIASLSARKPSRSKRVRAHARRGRALAWPRFEVWAAPVASAPSRPSAPPKVGDELLGTPACAPLRDAILRACNRGHKTSQCLAALEVLGVRSWLGVSRSVSWHLGGEGMDEEMAEGMAEDEGMGDGLGEGAGRAPNPSLTGHLLGPEGPMSVDFVPKDGMNVARGFRSFYLVPADWPDASFDTFAPPPTPTRCQP